MKKETKLDKIYYIICYILFFSGMGLTTYYFILSLVSTDKTMNFIGGISSFVFIYVSLLLIAILRIIFLIIECITKYKTKNKKKK